MTITKDTPTSQILALHGQEIMKVIKTSCLRREPGGVFYWTVAITGLRPVRMSTSETRRRAIDGTLVRHVLQLMRTP